MILGRYPKNDSIAEAWESVSRESKPTATSSNGQKITRPWDVWFNKLLQKVNYGDSPTDTVEISASTGINLVSTKIRVISATAGNTTITANPQITAGFDGQELTLEGSNDTRAITISNGSGVILKSGLTFVLGEYDMITLIYNKPNNVWVEKSNNH